MWLSRAIGRVVAPLEIAGDDVDRRPLPAPRLPARRRPRHRVRLAGSRLVAPGAHRRRGGRGGLERRCARPGAARARDPGARGDRQGAAPRVRRPAHRAALRPARRAVPEGPVGRGADGPGRGAPPGPRPRHRRPRRPGRGARRTGGASVPASAPAARRLGRHGQPRVLRGVRAIAQGVRSRPASSSLRDSSVEIAPGLVLAGVDDLSARRQFGIDGRPVDRALAGRPPGTTIYMSHSPWEVERAAELGVDLMLSGHTHAGQIWPFIYLVRLAYPYASGRYDVNGMTADRVAGNGVLGTADAALPKGRDHRDHAARAVTDADDRDQRARRRAEHVRQRDGRVTGPRPTAASPWRGRPARGCPRRSRAG